MRKFSRFFFWSHGTLLGYLGFLSQKAVPEIFSKWVLINLTNPLRHPEPLADPLLTKNLDTAGPWCVILCDTFLCSMKLGTYVFSFQRKLPEVGWSEIEIERLIRHFADMDSNNFPGLTTNNSIIFLLWKIIDFPGGHINDPLLG